MEIVETIQAALVPMVIISASGLLLLGIQQRYGRVIDRIRIFHGQLMENPEGRWRKIVDEQRVILIKRGKLLRNALSFLMVCILCALFATISLSVSIVYESVERIALVFFFLALLSLFFAVIFALVEIFISYSAVLKEDESIGNMSH